jgi:hypothetical protein
MVDSSFYFSVLYPFQDDVLRLVKEAKTGFHLTGGTALSRGYLKHRFSDDLDLFVNFDAHFGEWSNRVVDTFWRLGDWKTEVILREEYFVRAVLTRGAVTLKVEMVNDVGSRVGDVRDRPGDESEHTDEDHPAASSHRRAPKGRGSSRITLFVGSLRRAEKDLSANTERYS